MIFLVRGNKEAKTLLGGLDFQSGVLSLYF